MEPSPNQFVVESGTSRPFSVRLGFIANITLLAHCFTQHISRGNLRFTVISDIRPDVCLFSTGRANNIIDGRVPETPLVCLCADSA